MNLILFSRRGIHYKVGKKDYMALYVPGADEVVVYRDLPSTTAEVAQRMGAAEGVPLWREERGSAVVYGLMPVALQQLRQSIKVWLASDFATNDAEAFFFMFDRRWLVHGLRETDDEGQQHWRTTILEHTPDTIYQALADLAGDILLTTNVGNIIIAVDGNLKEFAPLQELLTPLKLSLTTFETLRPNPRSRILYRQRDYTLGIMISLFFMSSLLLLAMGWWIMGKMELSGLNDKISAIRNQINSIQLNDSLGQIEDPEGMLQLMKRAFNQQPSAIIDAAARTAAVFGDISQLSFDFYTRKADGAPDTDTPQPTDIRTLTVDTSKRNQALLVNQEERAVSVLPSMPWIRELSNVIRMGEGDRLSMVIQIDSPEGQTLPSATTVIDPAALPEDAAPEGAAPEGQPVSGSMPEEVSSTEATAAVSDSVADVPAESPRP